MTEVDYGRLMRARSAYSRWGAAMIAKIRRCARSFDLRYVSWLRLMLTAMLAGQLGFALIDLAHAQSPTPSLVDIDQRQLQLFPNRDACVEGIVAGLQLQVATIEALAVQFPSFGFLSDCTEGCNEEYSLCLSSGRTQLTCAVRYFNCLRRCGAAERPQ
jgi:hypothetical protein